MTSVRQIISVVNLNDIIKNPQVHKTEHKLVQISLDGVKY